MKKTKKHSKYKKKSSSKKQAFRIGTGIERARTGISELDSLIEGGVERNSVNLVAGSAGSGKSIFCTQFIVFGVQDYNEPGVYICFEEKKQRFFSHMALFGWDLARLEASKKFVFVEYTPEQVKKMIEEGGGLVENLVSKIKAKRVVIDSITSFSLLYQNEVQKKEAGLALFELLRKWNVTALVTQEISEEQVEKQEPGELGFESDSVILLYFIKEQNTRKRAIEILKMRGTKHSKRILPIDITPKGIVISKEGAVF